MKNSLLLLLFISALSATSAFGQLDSTTLLNDLKVLSSDEYGGRGIEQTGHDKAQSYIVDRFKKHGLQRFGDSFLHDFNYSNRQLKRKIKGTNVVGYMKGTKHTDKYIVVGAHYDHLGTVDGKIFNGADDNASGVATLLSLLAYFKENPPEHTIIFAAWDAEEAGLFGSFAFVTKPPVDLKAIKFYWNIDMMSRNANNEIYVCGTHYRPEFKDDLKHIYAKSKLKISFGHDNPKDKTKEDWTSSSDQGAFHQKKIPWLYYTVEDHEDYHEETDEFSRIMPSFYYQVANLVTESLEYVDKNLDEMLK